MNLSTFTFSSLPILHTLSLAHTQRLSLKVYLSSIGLIKEKSWKWVLLVCRKAFFGIFFPVRTFESR